ncbi:hypothetical protein PMAYCL1PPCAC_10581, partial [Pristionchus mayeri]
SDFNPSREKQFEWRLEDYLLQPLEMEANIRNSFEIQHVLKTNWSNVDIVCTIEYVKYFIATFASNMHTSDQIAVVRDSVIQLSLLEMHYYSWSAGYRHVTYPDGQIYGTRSSADKFHSKIATIYLTRSELSVMNALVV